MNEEALAESPPRGSTLKEVSETWKLALPMILGQVGQMTMGIVDTIVAGRVSTPALAGLGLGTIILWHSIMILLGLLLALDTFFSQAVGAKNEAALRHWLIQSIWLAIGLSVFSMAGLCLIEAGYRGMAPQTDANQEFSRYLLNALWSIPAIFGFFVLQRYWQARNRAVFLAIATVGANLLNLLVNLSLGLGWWGFPQWGTTGIAVATVVSRWAMLIAAILYTLYRLDKKSWSWVGPNIRAQGALLKLGWPAGGQALCEIGVFAIASVIAGFMGAIQIASHHICLTATAFTYMFSNGIASAAAVRVGQFVGARKQAAAVQAGHVALGMSGLVMASFSLIYLLASKRIATLFTVDQAVIELTTTIFLIVAVFQIADGLQVTAAGALRGGGNTRAPMIANAIGHFVIGFPISLTCAFVFDWGVKGLWTGLAIGLIVVAVLVTRIWFQRPQADSILNA